MIEIKQVDNIQDTLKRNDETDDDFKFKVGQKLSIDLEITDEKLSQILFTLLYKPESIKGSEHLGFKIDCIYLHECSRLEIKQKVLETAEILKQIAESV